jgi:hypothetical protein
MWLELKKGTTLLQNITASEFRISLQSGRIDVLIVTEEFTIDLGSCLRWWKPSAPSLWPVSDIFQLNIHRAKTAVMFCACEIIPLFSVVFCVFRSVHKFDFRLVVNETPNKWWPVEGHAVMMLVFLTRSICFPLIVVASVRGLSAVCRSTTFSWVSNIICCQMTLSVKKWVVRCYCVISDIYAGMLPVLSSNIG